MQKNDGVSHNIMMVYLIISYVSYRDLLSEGHIPVVKGRVVTSLMSGKFLSGAGQSLRGEWST